MEIPSKSYFRLANYTYDREYYIVTTNSIESDYNWECCVFCNDPQTDIRDFESLVECVRFDSQDDAKDIHSNMLYKWNYLGVA
jgi:hypothetical protein